MTRTNSNHNEMAKQPHVGTVDLDAYLIDDEDDEFLDRTLADFRESLADFRSL
jgi:hypothetical protein